MALNLGMQIQVKVKPNAKKQSIQHMPDGSFMIHLKSPPVDGKANKELIKILAKKYQVPQANVVIKSGHHGRRKRVDIDCIET